MPKSRSDGGTVVLHWLTVLSVVASLLTGLRISVDGLGAWAAPFFAPALPQGEIWTWHLLAGLLLFFCTLSYGVYVHRAALGSRNAASRLRTIRPPTTQRLRWRAVNVALHWFAYAAIFVLTVTGIVLYMGYGGWFVTTHRALAWAMLIYILIHTLAHAAYGGIDQLLRLFRPEPLPDTQRTRLWPLGLALVISMAGTTAFWAIDPVTRSQLTISEVRSLPTADGVLDDDAWKHADVVSIPTQQGANLGGSGESLVKIRAVRTGTHVAFAFRWQDPTRSLMRVPTVKRADGWYLLGSGVAQADVNDYYEDKFSVLFSLDSGPGGGRSTFLGSNPLPAYPKSPHSRGLHYTDDGRILDLWQWKSARGGLLHHVDDMHFGPPKAASKKQLSGTKRYSAGYSADPGQAIYEYNYSTKGGAGYDGPVQLKRLPVDLAALRAQLGPLPSSADESNAAETRWWMTRDDSVSYDAALDRHIPLGTILPSVLNIHPYSGDRADLTGGARWLDGWWTLEVSRPLVTGSPYDIAFQPGTQIFAWVAVFDHNQTRHTRHQRPIALHIQ